MFQKQIQPSKALYIKLGREGRWEDTSIQDGVLRLGFKFAPHDLCVQGQWIEVQKILEQRYKGSVGTATRALNQIKLFYEADSNVLWITLYRNRLYWCFSEPIITQFDEDSRTRPVIDQWQSEDILGKPLQKNQLSGKLLSVQRFQGTICNIKEFDYLMRKINGIDSEEVEEIRQARNLLEQRIEPLIQALHPKDFELLVDLIFNQAGWQRISILGESEKTLDLELQSPITNARYGVQVKSQASLADFEDYRRKFDNMQGDYAGYYFIVHSPYADLAALESPDNIELWKPHDLAQLSVKYGLIDWLIDKAS